MKREFGNYAREKRIETIDRRSDKRIYRNGIGPAKGKKEIIRTIAAAFKQDGDIPRLFLRASGRKSMQLVVNEQAEARLLRKEQQKKNRPGMASPSFHSNRRLMSFGKTIGGRRTEQHSVNKPVATGYPQARHIQLDRKERRRPPGKVAVGRRKKDDFFVRKNDMGERNRNAEAGRLRYAGILREIEFADRTGYGELRLAVSDAGSAMAYFRGMVVKNFYRIDENHQGHETGGGSTLKRYHSFSPHGLN